MNTLRGRTYRLGYWRKGDKIWHGIRRGPNYCGGKISGLDTSNRPTLTAVYDGFSKPLCIVLAIISYGSAIALITCLAREDVRDGCTFHVPSISEPLARTFFRGFLTTLAGTFNLFWLSADTFYRATQPFAGMQRSQPATENLLLDYLCCLPVAVSIKAATNSHWKVAYFSWLSLSANLFPILVSALFTSTSVGNGVIVTAPLRNFCVVFIFILIYCISIPFAWPTQKRMLPRSILSLGDLISFCYDSKLLASAEYEHVFALNRPTDTRRHMESRLFLKEERYKFHTYETSSGWRTGFDMVREEDV